MQVDVQRTAGIAWQRWRWSRRAGSWDHHARSNIGLGKVTQAILEVAQPAEDAVAVDLGCGSGQVTLPLARKVREVLAVDVTSAMTSLLERNARAEGVTNVRTRVSPVEQLRLEPGSVDLIVSSYVLHHLRDPDKAALVREAARWLRPGGRLVIGDMMFGRGGDARDRQIILEKVRLMAQRGPAGWWRVVKNAGRYLFRVQERPVSMKAWVRMFEQAGLVDIVAHAVVAEAGVVAGARGSGDLPR